MTDDFINIGNVLIYLGGWFNSTDEANDWLDFDSDDDELDQYAYAYPDHFAEWQQWKEQDASSN